MVSKQRSMQDFYDPEEFNFSITSGNIVFGSLYNVQNTTATTPGSKTRIWKLTIELYEGRNIIPIKRDYIDNTKLNKVKQKNWATHIYTETGLIDGKIVKSASTIVHNGKNLGKSNETTIITQSLLDGRSKYALKINKGYSTEMDPSGSIAQSVSNQFPFPMAVNTYSKYQHKLVYPLYIQPKLDGIRMVAKRVGKKVVLKTRRLHDFPDFDFVINELEDLLSNEPELFIDGELYCHGMNLQAISGLARSTSKSTEDRKQLQYWIFDCFDIKNKNMTFEERYNKLQKIFGHKKYTYLTLVETHKANNSAEGDKLFDDYIKRKYEGIIYKNSAAKYEFSFLKEKRSMLFLKRKNAFDEEYIIEDFKEGTKGKDIGAVIFVMKTPDGHTFSAVPNATYEERQDMFKDCKLHFNTKYKGKMATIHYDDLSEKKVPLRAKFITIRHAGD